MPHSDADDSDDSALFRAAIGPVKPLPDAPVSPLRKPAPRPAARMAERDEQDARGEFQRLLESDGPLLEAGDSLRYRRSAVPARIWQRLRRGQFSVQDELDLHGATAAQAETMLRQFLAEAVQAGFGCVRIIHGKGRSGGGPAPVLKNLIDRMLRQRRDVLAFHSAPHAQGGTGAVLVLLTGS
ncbi:MAG: Smr/MutS family protein [Xanthomonadaceae bacterium]|jgi:DNA-nicking Smr family endonuclease|nr:Smr/MutS family protein [Xanthomonadaceae bacterium]